ncbi:MarR family winged helix-turn-helix transcriptional regulator [Saccharothrix algeriensis]|uniref:DNA-binding MarR family transcriptional regulator n=1 Tax=Saccharothrix algeriensis TaxID=173560 RepID=A0ABS2S6I9_9PSEU|nr:MarR family transcriptional regulator [Saccharothrix algeriensis]MBM7811854.1 DNA-binding MarR family transcriptional regulator [Saccharothrix algeriensis]
MGDAAGDPRLADAERVGTALVRLNKMHACVAAHLSRAGLDKASFVLLANLSHLGPSRSSALAEAVFSDPSTVSRQVATLVKEGWVERRADPDDGRASVLAVTDAGKRLLEERRLMRNRSIARMLADWSEEDLAAFLDHFERFVGDYERALPEFIAESGLGPRSEGES